MERTATKLLSLEEYNQLEEETSIRYEYHNGEVFAMAGGSPRHGIIAGNIIRLLGNHLKKRCRVGSSDLKFYIESINKSLYPDASVICQPYQVSKHDRNALTNPILLVEVLSESTANYDPVSTAGGNKFHYYSELPSLREYVLIEQNIWKVETRYRSTAQEEWKMNWFEGEEASVTLHSMNVTIPLAEIYQETEGL
ncbi:Uma2 family endonuclease [Tunicatimonas pelagia]|uniref:Uma2 family endonuclease n=1 Tax=Tunicatimonas pelagia TaxID=931531 RepID=UPI002665FD50|nr:Uma2 family endonuclease [Tunicatimonas pelagia]WKN45119.1 Uma2 family endonuclease [Tunicatimonas pelagia]